MDISKTDSVGKIVRADCRAADVFNQHGIDFCCGGKKSLDAACAEKGLHTEGVLSELKTALVDASAADHRFDEMPLTNLVDFIETKHHHYIRTSLPHLVHYVEKVAHTHGGNYPELIAARDAFMESVEDLTFHLQKEERILFPYIRILAKAVETGADAPHAGFGTVENPIRVMTDEHDTEGGRFAHIRELLDGYKIPTYACMTWRVMLQKLEEFERDLHQHIHIENNILFPKALELENRLN